MRPATRRSASVLAAIALVASPRAFAFQVTTRVSVDSSGTEGNNVSGVGGISADGRFVACWSDASNLVTGDTNNNEDVFVFDRASGTTERVSVDSSGNQVTGGGYVDSTQPLSGDGRLVVFTSHAAFDPGDTNGTWDVFVRDRVLGTTTRVSVDSSGNTGDSESRSGALLGDGLFVAFDSKADNLVAGDTNGVKDVFVHDLVVGTTERISVDSSGNEAGAECAWPSISADGSVVAFFSTASNLVTGDTNGTWDVFVRDRVAGTTERVSVDSSGAQADDMSVYPSISADGRFVAFRSNATNLVAGDQNKVPDIFVHDRATGATTRVSVSSGGYEGNGWCHESAISADGRFVLFSSFATDLVAGDTNHVQDVFLRDTSAGTTTRVSVDSTGTQANDYSIAGGISADGSAVVFQSDASNLVASDNNWATDVFVRDGCGVFATWSNYGAGYPGTHGIPAFTAQQFPALGATITVDLGNSYGQPTIGFLVLGLQRASLPTKWGGDLLVLPTLIAPITFSYGGDSFTGTIPDDFELCGVTIDLQGIENDPGAAFGVSFSQGLELVIGS